MTENVHGALRRVVGDAWHGRRRTAPGRRPRRLGRLGRLSGGNRVEVLRRGAEAFEQMWGAIAGASQRVWLETYGFAGDAVGLRTLDALVAAARRGCEVRLIYDAIGSRGTPEPFFAPLRAAGGETVRFNPLLPWPGRLPAPVRDHRKILIVDDRVGFCGGMNISVNYAGPPHAPAIFRDCQVRIEGPGAADLGRIFLDTLALANGESGSPPKAPTDGAAAEVGVIVQALGSNTRRNIRSIQRALRQAIGQARTHCYLTTPYFVPPRRLARAIAEAARRGVDVRVLTAGRTDIPLTRLAARHYYRRLIEDGVRIYEMRDEVIHTKRASVDGALGMVGSFNLDHWSDRHNLEVAVVIVDDSVANELDEHFLEDLHESVEISESELDTEPLVRRMLQPLAAWFFRR